MDFAGSSILCQFRSSDSATVPRWFCDSLSVQYIRSLHLCFAGSTILRQFSTIDFVNLQLCFAGSAILRQFRTSDPEIPAFVLRWFYDSLSVQYIRSCIQSCKCASPILRFCVGSTSETVLRFRPSANSSILCWLRESCCGFR